MKRIAPMLTLLAALGAPPPGLAEDDDEHLRFFAPPRWHVVYEDREENLSTTEYVPDGETAENWTQMLTVQILLGSGESDPETMLAKVALHLAKDCREYDAKPIDIGKESDYPTMGMLVLCGRHGQHDGGEFHIIRGISGDSNFYLLSRIWRTPAYTAADEPPVAMDDRRFWLGYLAFLEVCDPAVADCEAPLAVDETVADDDAATDDED